MIETINGKAYFKVGDKVYEVGGGSNIITADSVEQLPDPASVPDGTIALVKSEGGGSESVSWNDLTDKPFGEIPITTDTITWDGKSDIVVGDMLYYVSDYAPTTEKLVGCSVVLTVDGNEETVVVAEEGIIPAAENLFLVSLSDTMFFAVTSADNVSADGIELPKKGIYFTENIKSATFLAPFETTVSVKIDPKYVPNELPEIPYDSDMLTLGVVNKKWAIVEKDRYSWYIYTVILRNILDPNTGERETLILLYRVLTLGGRTKESLYDVILSGVFDGGTVENYELFYCKAMSREGEITSFNTLYSADLIEGYNIQKSMFIIDEKTEIQISSQYLAQIN